MMIVSEGSTFEFSMMTPVVYSSPCPRWMQGTVAEETVFFIYEAIRGSLSVSWVILASPLEEMVNTMSWSARRYDHVLI